MNKKKIAILITLPVIAVAGAALAWIGPRNVVGMIRYDQREEGTLKVGDAAPDVELFALDGARRESLAGHFGERPLVLVFGSFT